MSQVEANANEQFADAELAHGSRGFLTVIWQRKALVVLGTVLGLIGGSLVYWQRTAVFSAGAQIHVIKKNNPIPIRDGDRVAGYEDYMATHMVVLRSPYIIERAIKKKDLASLKTFENGDPAGQILGSFGVARDKETLGGSTNILNLSYRGPVADDCSKILTAIIDAYQEYLDVKYTITTDQTLSLIKTAHDVIGKELREAEDAYKKFREQGRVLITKEGINTEVANVMSYEKRCEDEIQKLEGYKNQTNILEKAVKEGTGQITLSLLIGANKVTSPNTLKDDLLLELQMKELSLQETYGENHPKVIEVRRQMELVRKRFEKSSGGSTEAEKDPVQHYIRVLKQQQEFTELNIHSLMKAHDRARVSARSLTEFELEESRLRKEVARREDLFQELVKRLAQLNLMRDAGVGFDAQVLSVSPSVKVAPIAYQMIAAGLMGGLLAGIGFAFLADLTDKSFRNPDEVRVRLGLPLLGHVPFLQADPEAAKKVEAGEIAVDPMLLSLFRPKSLEAEAYRAVRTAIFFSVQGEGHRVLQVSSPNKGDGKSLMVSNLAISMAQSGKKVLVIDADCRRPRQHKIFGLANTAGLSTVLANGGDWHTAVHATPVEGLSIMPSGPIPPNPSELLSSPRFGEVLESARPEYDYVMVDTPPLLAVTDPCVVAGHVDGLVLILRLSRQGRPHAERAREILKSLGVKVLGVVVNGITRQSGTGIYSSEHYDYTESYEQAPDAEGNDGYYYHDEDTPEAPAQK